MTEQEVRDALETYIDVNGAGAAVELIAQVCIEKANTIRATYKDMATAAMWCKTAKLLRKLYAKLP